MVAVYQWWPFAFCTRNYAFVAPQMFCKRKQKKHLQNMVIDSDLQKYESIRSVKLNKYPNDANLLDRVRDIRQNHWTMKYRPLWSTNSMRSLIVSD